MNVTIATYGKSIMSECDHMEVARVPMCVAEIVRNQLGTAYERTPTITRWAAMFSVPTIAGIYRLPFELVICDRGASLRCRWTDVNLLSEIVGRMVPEIVAEPIVQEVPMSAR